MSEVPHWKAGDKPKYPFATICLYGPDDQETAKVVVVVFTRASGRRPAHTRRWLGPGIMQTPAFLAELKAYLTEHEVKQTVISEGNMGCVHEEGKDFPMGEDCPFCPWWKGKQGTARKEEGEAGD